MNGFRSYAQETVQRTRAVRALFNFRDLGGYPTVAGERTRHGRVFRSDGLHRCAEADLALLEQFGLVRVVDLRTPHERTNDGCFDPTHPVIDYRHVPVLDELCAEYGSVRRYTLAMGATPSLPDRLHAELVG